MHAVSPDIEDVLMRTAAREEAWLAEIADGLDQGAIDPAALSMGLAITRRGIREDWVGWLHASSVLAALGRRAALLVAGSVSAGGSADPGCAGEYGRLWPCCDDDAVCGAPARRRKAV